VAERIRIVIALDTASRVASVIEIGAALGAGLHAMLDALFVEDEQLLRLAALPFAHELGFPSARLRRIGAEDVERALRGQIEECAGNSRRRPRRSRCRGSSSSCAAMCCGRRSATRASPTSSCSGGASRRRCPPRDSPRRQVSSLRRRAILALFDGNAAGVKALAAAQALARVAPGELVVLIPASGPEPFRRLREQAAAIVAPGAPGPSQYISIPDVAVGTIARTARAQSAAVLVWPGDGRDPGVLAGIVDAVSCPVVVVG
jgi:hypothetical protein